MCEVKNKGFIKTKSLGCKNDNADLARDLEQQTRAEFALTLQKYYAIGIKDLRRGDFIFVHLRGTVLDSSWSCEMAGV